MSKISDEVRAIIDTFPALLKGKVLDWLELDKNSNTLNEIINLVKQKDEKELSNALLNRQEFGTAGIRGHMKAGFNSVNDLIIIQTSQGLAKYLAKINNEKSISNGIVIGYDGRHNSFRFARLAARVFLHQGFRVNLFSRIVPTPFVAFAVKCLSASAGVMVTASHNPKQYNGYKVYLDNGAQIISPHDTNIQEEIMDNLVPWDASIWDVSTLSYDNKLIDPLQIVMDKYMATLLANATQLDKIGKTDLKVVYTCLHGVGHEYLTHMFKLLGFKNPIPVDSQKNPDPDFPTVSFPNPEEGKGVWNESIKTATNNNATLCIANDPDSDRFAIAELNDGQWYIFNGNEIGALLGWWVWYEQKEIRKVVGEPKDYYMISSAVSSKILESISKKENFSWTETLTGFKWMANKANDLVKDGKHVLMAFEEAIGYMVGTNVLDKDGVSAAAAGFQMAVHLRSNNSSLLKQLKSIYDTYGYHFSLNSYFICHDQEKIKAIFNRVADLDGPNKYFDNVAGYKVVRIRDLNRGYDSSTPDNKPTLPTSTASFMLTVYFENGSVITFRTSGTEPKIKYYSEIIASPDEKDHKKVERLHKNLVDAAVELVLEPTKNNLIPKSD